MATLVQKLASDVTPGEMVQEQGGFYLVTAKSTRGIVVDLSLEGLDYTYGSDEFLTVKDGL